MKIVIDIPEEYYSLLKGFNDEKCSMDMLLIKHGTPLPKGHGRLIDADVLLDQISRDKREAFTKHQVWLLLSQYNDNAPTIIEADTESEKDSSTGSSTTNIGSSTGSTIEALEERTRTHASDSSEHETHEERTEKVGHWIEHEWAEESEGYLISNFECDKCHAWAEADYAYCPNCGVKMEV